MRRVFSKWAKHWRLAKAVQTTVARDVGILLIVKGVFGIVVAEIEFVPFGEGTCLTAELTIGDRTAADVIKPSTKLICRPVGDGHAGNAGRIEFLQLIKGLESIAPALVGHAGDNNTLGRNLKAVGLLLVLRTLNTLNEVTAW